MNLAITGASGFIGTRLVRRLTEDGHSLHVLGRRPPFVDAIDGADAVIHLAGEPVAQRWSPRVKQRIRDSRILGTRAIVNAIAEATNRPHVLVSASAIGFYGDRGEELLDEGSAPGSGFLPELCLDWEREARRAEEFGLRVVTLRIGIVLGREGGALKQMLTPFRLGVGGPTGSGRQWMSWIHIDDLVEAIVFAVNRSDLSGAVNGTAPNPVRNEEFARALGRAIRRPIVVSTPVFALKVILGEAAEVVVSSQRVLPRALERAGFRFRYAEINDALRSAVSS